MVENTGGSTVAGRHEADIFGVANLVVAITGGGRGIGRVLALAFAERGAHLALASRTLGEVEAVAAEASALGTRASATACDVRSVADLEAFVDGAVVAHGRIDVLINNAGVYLNRPLLEQDEADWDLMIDTNLKGAFFGARAAARHMLERKSGRILNVSTALAHKAQRGYVAYGAAKAGVENMTRVLAYELAGSGITVNCIAPTTTELPEQPDRLRTPPQLERARTTVPMGRFATTDDLVGAALYFASPAAAFVTGQTLVVDGGFAL